MLLKNKLWIALFAASAFTLTGCGGSDSSDPACDETLLGDGEECPVNNDDNNNDDNNNDDNNNDDNNNDTSTIFDGSASYSLSASSTASSGAITLPTYTEWPSTIVTEKTSEFLNDGSCVGATAHSLSYAGASNSSLGYTNTAVTQVKDGAGINVCDLPTTLSGNLTLSPYSIYRLTSSGMTISNNSTLVIPKGTLVLAQADATLTVNPGSSLITGADADPESDLVTSDQAITESTVFHSEAWAKSASGAETAGYWKGIVNNGQTCTTYQSGEQTLNCDADMVNTAIFGATDALTLAAEDDFKLNRLYIKDASDNALILDQAAQVTMDYSVIDQSSVAVADYVIKAKGKTLADGNDENYLDPNNLAKNGKLTLDNVLIQGNSASTEPVMSFQQGMSANISNVKMFNFGQTDIEFVDRATLENGTVSDTSTGLVTWSDTYTRVQFTNSLLRGSNLSLSIRIDERDETHSENRYASETEAEGALVNWKTAQGLVYESN